ncbi:MAG: sensor histidine kinase [Lachnospiraceae bacterium]
MNSNSIKKLRKQIVSITFRSFLLVIVIILSVFYIVFLSSIRSNYNTMMDYIIENDGELPDDNIADNGSFLSEVRELRYTTRYFAVIFDEDRNVVEVIDDHIQEVNRQTAIDMSEKIIERSFDLIQYENGYFYKSAELDDGNTIVVVVDASLQMSTFRQIVWYTIFILIIGLVLTFIVVRHMSARAIRQEIENNTRQKQFITNASHELKTPLAVIRANTELIEMMNGESEWTQSTLRQVDRMNGLIQNLVMITRAQENEDRSGMMEINVSETVRKAAEQFRPLAEQDKKEFEFEIEDDVKMVALESSLQQLTMLLVDNAIKYCDDGGQIRISLRGISGGKKICLKVSNSYANEANIDCSKFFDRFYREDESHHNTEDKGGYGIGLSVAESICEQYGGSIDAQWKDGVITFTCILCAVGPEK